MAGTEAGAANSTQVGETPDPGPSETAGVAPVLGRLGPFIPWVFAGWTLFVWGGRLRNIFADPEGLASVGWPTSAGATVFFLLGLALLAMLVLGRRGSPGRALRAVVLSLAGLTVLTWLVRGIDIAAGDHTVGFIAVHLLLAVVSIALAGLSVVVVGGSVRRR